MSWDLQWSVEAWLETLGLAAYTEQFIDNGYDLQELCANLRGEDLDAIGVQTEHHRTRIFAESSALRDEAMARFKKSNGGGSAGSTDQSGSMGSHGSFPAYTEPWGDDVPKHLYSDVWIGEQVDGGHTTAPALALLMQNGGQGQALGDQQKGLTFPPAVPPPKTPRKKVKLTTSPASQSSSTLPAAPALPPPRRVPQTTGGLNKVQLKLKVLEELQKDKIILSESPYCRKDGSKDEEKISELCQTYSERFHIEPAQILETMKDICKGTEAKGHDETDPSSSPSLRVQNAPVLSTSDIYEEPVDRMKNGVTTFKESSPPGKAKRTMPAAIAAEDVDTEAAAPIAKPSPPLKKGNKKKGSPVFLQKPKPSSSESSPEQKRRGSPRTSPYSSPQPSPVTSPREHKKFGLFGKWKDKKVARSQSTKEVDLTKQGKGGRAVLLPGKSPLKKGHTEDPQTASPSLLLASKKHSSGATLTYVPPPSSEGGTEPSPALKHRTTSMSSTSTTGSDTSPLPTKKFGIMRFSQRWDSLQRHRKTKTKGGQKKDFRNSLTASDIELNRVGLKSDKETRQELLRSTQSHEHLFDTRAPQDSPPVAEKTKKESKQRGRFFKLLMKKRTMVKSGRKGVKGRRHTGEGEEGEGGARGETEHGEEESQSFLTSSISMPNIASEALRVQGEDDTASTSTSTLHTGQVTVQVDKSTTLAPPKPSCHVHVVQSPDPSPLPQRKVAQSGITPSGDVLIPIQDGAGEGGRGGEISSWQPLSPSHLLLHPTQSFDSDVFSGATDENMSDFEERTNKRVSLGSCQSETYDSASLSSSTTNRNLHVAGSMESQGSSVFGSHTSGSSFSGTKPPTAGSLKKPLPPPKPKSLERGTRPGRSTPPCVLSERQVAKERVDKSDGGIGTNERVVPPKKPPRPMRGSVKRDQIQEMDGESPVAGRGGGGGGWGGGEGAGVEMKPPPKPPRRNRSVKLVKPEQQDLTPQRKAQTMLPRTNSGGSASSESHSSISSVPRGVPGSVPRKPTPAPKPRSISNASRNLTESVEAVAPPSLEENIASRLAKEGIDLTVTPYSNVWGEGGVPSLLVSRYAQELDHPPESVALVIDEIRGRSLKKMARDYVPVRRVDCMKNTSISTDTVADFLTSVGLPMYSSVLTRSRGYANVPSLRRLNDVRLNELGIVPRHRKTLLDQLHKL